MQVLISGREVAVQESFRDPSQVLHVLPYFVPKNKREKENGEPYVDINKRLNHDQRNDWWLKYSAATSYNYDGLPEDLNRGNLTEITAQPLLNYLVALSYVKKKLTIVGATLDRATLVGVSLYRASLYRVSLNGARLDGARLVKTDLKDISWDMSTKWRNVKGLDKALNVPEKLRQHLSKQRADWNSDNESEDL